MSNFAGLIPESGRRTLDGADNNDFEKAVIESLRSQFYTSVELIAGVLMKLQRNFMAVTCGVGAYLALFLTAGSLPRLVNLLFSSKGPLDNIGLVGLVFFACLPVTLVVAPFLGGFVTAKTATERPYLHLVYALLISCGLLCLAGYVPRSFKKVSIVGYGLLFLLSFVSSVAGAWFGGLNRAQQRDEELMHQLRESSSGKSTGTQLRGARANKNVDISDNNDFRASVQDVPE